MSLFFCVQEDELVKIASQKIYIDHGNTINPGKINQELSKTLPSAILKSGNPKVREHWTHAIMQCMSGLGCFSGEITSEEAKCRFVQNATRKWPLQFSGLFEAMRVSGPALPKNEIVIAVNCRGLFMLDEPFKIAMGFPFFELVDVSLSKYIFNILHFE